MVTIAKKAPKQTCEICCYYIEALRQDGRKYDEAVSGVCRRFPPNPVAYSDGEHHIETVIWPMVNRWEWCGEFAEI